MRPVPTDDTRVFGDAAETIDFRIDAASFAEIQHTLSNIYSKPVDAVVREYATNALDSHIEAGQIKPIAITLPTAHNLQFTVQDWGVGLSLDELREVYTSYGLSTKRNNDAVTGQLGLGSKSGLTYAQLGFSVTAIKDGVKVLATILIEDHVGRLKVLDSFATDEVDGVKITIPVRKEDIDRFRLAARDFFEVWPVGSVLIDGRKPKNFRDREGLIWLDDSTAVITDESGHWVTSKIVLGNVPYPVKRTSAWGFSVISFVKPGAIHFTPNREELLYTPLTNATLDTLFARVDAEIMTHTTTEILGQPTAFAKVKRYNEITDRIDYSHKKVVSDALFPLLPAPLSIEADETCERYAYEYEVSHQSWRQKRNGANVSALVPWSWLLKLPNVVTGYPYKARTLSTRQKDLLGTWVKDTDPGSYGCLLLPDTLGQQVIDGFLDGFPGAIATWDDVLAATPVHIREAKEKTAKTKTLYEVFSLRTVLNLAKLDPADGPIVWFPRPVQQRGYSSHRMPNFGDRYPEAQVALLASNQVDRFLRLHPTAVAYGDYDRRETELARKALKQVDIQAWQLQHDPIVNLGRDAVTEIDDWELRELLLLAGYQSDRLARAKALGVSREEDPIFAKLNKRYPLAVQLRWNSHQAGGKTDLVIYLNAKYSSIDLRTGA